MREIKFRAWDKEKKEWIGDEGTTFTSETATEGIVALLLSGNLRVFSAEYIRGDKKEDDLISVGHSEYESIHPMKTNPPYKRQYILMQYTGLKDKNGKEIYEGDIVEDQFEDAFMKLHNIAKTNHLVMYQDGCFMLSYNGEKVVGNQSDIASSLLQYNTVKVIGNIYKNPELLEAKK